MTLFHIRKIDLSGFLEWKDMKNFKDKILTCFLGFLGNRRQISTVVLNQLDRRVPPKKSMIEEMLREKMANQLLANLFLHEKCIKMTLS